MIILFLLIGCGYICSKCNLITQEHIPFLSKVVLNLGIPAAILSSVSNGTSLNPKELVINIAGFFLFNVLCALFSKLVVKVLGITNDKKLYEFMYMFSNIAFMGLPVVQAVLGDRAMIYATLFLLPSNLVLFSYGENLMRDTREFSLKKFFNPAIIASILAIIVCVINYRPPYIITKTLVYHGNITTPLAMVIIGVSLGNVSIWKMFKNKEMLVFLIVKMIVLPLIYWKILNSLNINEIITSMLVLLMAMPIPSNAVVYASIYKKNIGLATQASVLTSIVSVFSIPIVFLIISIL